MSEHDRLLDAARACVLAVGVRRTTVTEVARRAGVSRMTLYRRFPDIEAVLSTLMTREFGRLVARSTAAAADGSARERVVAMVVGGARAVAEDPLFARLVDVDPELLLPYVTQRLGGMQRMAVAAAAAVLAEPDGSVRDDVPPLALSAAIELMVRGFVLAARSDLEPSLDPWAELAHAVDGYLQPRRDQTVARSDRTAALSDRTVAQSDRTAALSDRTVTQSDRTAARHDRTAAA